MNTLKRSLGGATMSIAELIVGILLLIDPVGFTSGIIMSLGAVLIVWGLFNVVKYFRSEPEAAEVRQLLAKGLALLLLGAVCAFHSHWFVATFPVLTLIYGVVIMVSGLTKIQWMADALRMKRKRWFWALISAVISLACGIVIVTNPFSSTAVLWVFTGISLIVEAVFDLIAAVWGNREDKECSGAETL